MIKNLLLCTFLVLAICTSAFALESEEMLADPQLEARERAISLQIRCPSCQGETIDTSDAPLSKDLRALVRKRIALGDSDTEVKQYIVGRYGQSILMNNSNSWFVVITGLAVVFSLAATAAIFYKKSKQ